MTGSDYNLAVTALTAIGYGVREGYLKNKNDHESVNFVLRLFGQTLELMGRFTSLAITRL